MSTYDIAEAGARLADLLDRAESGEVVRISRAGHASVRLTAERAESDKEARRQAALDAMHARHDALGLWADGDPGVVSQMRDERERAVARGAWSPARWSRATRLCVSIPAGRRRRPST